MARHSWDPLASLSRLLVIPFVLLCIITLAQGASALWSLQRIATSSRIQIARLHQAESVLTDLLALRLEAFQFVGAKTPQSQAPIAAGFAQRRGRLTDTMGQGLDATAFAELASLYGQAMELQRNFKTSKAYEILNGPSLEQHQRLETAVRSAAQAVAEDVSALDAARRDALLSIIVMVAMAVAAVIGTLVLIRRRVQRPMHGLVGTLERIGSGDRSARAIEAGADEIRVIVAALNRMAATLEETGRGAAERSVELAGQAEKLTKVGERTAATAAETSALATKAAASTEKVVNNVSSVASATEQLSASAKEMARNSAEASQVSEKARARVAKSDEMVGRLSAASAEIGSVVKLIAGISAQTNLLALNATIEAARAGEAGRGFAVVANEVKTLADQTQKATTDIADRISGIQATSREAAESMREVAGIIGRIAELQQIVTATVEAQSAMTEDIASNLHQANDGVKDISEAITSVTHTADANAALGRELISAAQAVNQFAARLVDLTTH